MITSLTASTLPHDAPASRSTTRSAEQAGDLQRRVTAGAAAAQALAEQVKVTGR